MSSPIPLPALARPLVCAPMAGGPSTPELAAAVDRAGGLGFLAAGYLSPEALREQIERARSLGARRLGVNLFLPQPGPNSRAELEAYRKRLAPEYAELGAEPPEGFRFDDDALEAKAAVLEELRPDAVSTTFGLPSPELVSRLRAAGIAVLATVTSPDEIGRALAGDADGVVVQGAEAGGHRGAFDPYAEPEEHSTPDLVRAAAGHPARRGRPVIAAGGISSPEDLRAALDAGALAGQAGTAFLLAEEAGTKPLYREALLRLGERPTAVTRAFSGRAARSVENAMTRKHSAEAPSAYPEVHYLTAPLRAAAAAAGDAEHLNLWAGERFAEVVAGLGLAGERAARPASEIAAWLAPAG
ncbi:NAD(P)H-dependent flavin oxidoreductase [Arthrobacter sp. UM1]|uniref:NAD(P)H-dependent flavin oxidoreductase n=1 Tax=Arthrobacter sp. UM1 TaxID=2766776 RepID=UPI001CF6E2D4|nr:nitronate monooxygenase [Arthrobacter sp. UM1]MCB4207750.1 nitronate monooxygenase [Arthrobacter sp. UM1]